MIMQQGISGSDAYLFPKPPLKYLPRYCNNHKKQITPPVPLKAIANGGLMGALRQSEVDKMVDVNVPLTMNYRGVNISKHKD